MSYGAPVVVPAPAARSVGYTIPDSSPPLATVTGTSAPSHSSPLLAMDRPYHSRSPSQPSYSPTACHPGATISHRGGSRTQPNSPTSPIASGKPRAVDLAALPSFSHRLSEFATMGIVPGDILSGCLRTGTAQVCKEKLDHVLAANNKVLGPYSSSSEDELSSYSSDSHYPTIRRRPFPGLTPIHPVSPTSPSRSVFNHQPSSSNSTGSASSAVRALVTTFISPTNVGRNPNLMIDPRTANALLTNQISRETGDNSSTDTPGLSSPPALVDSNGYVSDSSPGAPPAPYGAFTRSTTATINYFSQTLASSLRSTQDTESDSDTATHQVTVSNSGTIRLNRRVSARSSRASRSASRTPRAQRSPERDKATATIASMLPLPVSVGNPIAVQQNLRDREAAMFKSALERAQKGSVRRIRTSVKARFDLSSDSDGDSEEE